MDKLEYLSELSRQLKKLDDLKNKYRQTLEISQTEEIGLLEFRRERDKLAEEKESVTEVLRHINGDINSMDSVIKQTESEKNKHMDTAKMLIHEFRHCKSSVDKIRTHIGLPPLDDDNSIDAADLADQLANHHHLHQQQQNHHHHHSGGRLGSLIPSDWPPNEPIREFSNISTGFSNNSTGNSKGNLAKLNSFGQHAPSTPSSNRQNADPIINSVQQQQQQQQQQRRMERSVSSAFCQQPPPMKSCQTCDQQIHRNAPICPYCKSKSRSRNPKKPKKKTLN